MTRKRLPDRRPSTNLSIAWATEAGEHQVTLTAGFDPATGALAEVFYSDGQKTGSQLQHTMQDACVIISIALQHGVTVAELAHSLGRVPLWGRMAPASPIGAIIDALEGV